MSMRGDSAESISRESTRCGLRHSGILIASERTSRLVAATEVNENVEIAREIDRREPAYFGD